jgi:hypothetical protein
MSTLCGGAGHQEMKDLSPGKKCENGLMSRRNECHKSLMLEKGKVVEGDSSRDKKRISSQNKTKYGSRAFTNYSSGDKGIAFDKQEGSQQYNLHNNVELFMKVSNDLTLVVSTQKGMVRPVEKKGLSLQHQKIYEGIIFYHLLIQVMKNRVFIDSTTWLYLVLLIAMVCFNIGICTYDGNVENATENDKTMETKRNTTEDCVISVTGLVAKEATVKVLTSNCDNIACKSKHLTTQTFCHFMWRTWFAFCAYSICHVTCYSAFLIPNGCKEHIIALMKTFICWTGARMSTFVLGTNKCNTNTFTVHFPATRHTTTHVPFSNSHILSPHVMPVKFQRTRFFKRSSTAMMLAVVLTLFNTPESHAQQVSLKLCFFFFCHNHYLSTYILTFRCANVSRI